MTSVRATVQAKSSPRGTPAVIHDLDLHHLIALHHLLTERQVTLAAARLGITQSSMSHRLRRLRELLGDPLLVRVGGELALTPRAQGIRGPLAEAVTGLRSAVRVPERFEPSTSVLELTIAMPDLLTVMLPRLSEALTAAAPHISLRVQTVGQGLGEALASGAPMLALAPSNFAHERIRARRLGQLRFAVAMRRGHPARRGPFDTARWLAHAHAVVEIGNERTNLVTDALKRAGLTRRIGLVVPSFLSGLLAVSRSDLFMNVPMPIAEEVVRHLGLMVREAPITLPRVPFALLSHERFASDPAQVWARQMVFGAVQPLFAGHG